MILESFTVSGASFDIAIAPGPATGKRYPVVVVLHGNAGLTEPWGTQLKELTDEIAKLGYVAALPSYYPRGRSNLEDSDPGQHVSVLTAAMAHLARRSDVDADRVGLVGVSLGGGVAALGISRSIATRGTAAPIRVFADFFGYVSPMLAETGGSAAKFPPTIILHQKDDPLVEVSEHSQPFIDALKRDNPIHEIRLYPGNGHAFTPGSQNDLDSRADLKAWLSRHMPPTGIP